MQFPGLVGVLPGFGRQEPNDWGLGFELRDAQVAALDGRRATRRATFGHFGRSGTFLWVDPDAGHRARVPDRPRVRRLGDRRVAAARRRRAGRSCRVSRDSPDGWRGQAQCSDRNSSRSAFSSSGWSMPDEVAGAGDDGELGAGISSARCCGDRAEVGLVVVADDDERRRSRATRAARSSGQITSGSSCADCSSSARRCCGRTSSWCSGCDPEVEVDLRRGVEVAGVDRRLLGGEVVAHLLRPVPGRQPGADEHEPRDELRVRERGAQRDRAAERVADERRRQVLGDDVDERERLRRQRRLTPARQVGRDDSCSRESAATWRFQSRESPSAEWSRTTFIAQDASGLIGGRWADRLMRPSGCRSIIRGMDEQAPST